METVADLEIFIIFTRWQGYCNSKCNDLFILFYNLIVSHISSALGVHVCFLYMGHTLLISVFALIIFW